MALNPNVNCVARFRIEQNGYALSPLDTNARAGPQTISVVWDASGPSYGPVGGPGGVDPIIYCLNLLKALIVPQAPSGLPPASLQGPFVVSVAALIGQSANSVQATAWAPGAGGNP